MLSVRIGWSVTIEHLCSDLQTVFLLPYMGEGESYKNSMRFSTLLISCKCNYLLQVPSRYCHIGYQCCNMNFSGQFIDYNALVINSESPIMYQCKEIEALPIPIGVV